MTESESSSALNYQVLIERAFKCGEGKHGAKRGFFQNLYRAERGESHGLMGGSFKVQYADIKNNIHKALKKLQETGSKKEKYVALDNRLEDCTTVQCLSEIVDEALDIYRRPE